MPVPHLFVVFVTHLLLRQGFVHATVEIIDSFDRKVEDFPNRYATFINVTMKGYIESAIPSDACTPIGPPTFPKIFTMYKMVLINGTRTCDFMTKVQNAKAAGYHVAVLFDPSPEPFEYPNMTFPLVDDNLSVILLLFEDAIVIRRNFLYHNISDKENFILSINSNVGNLERWQHVLIVSGVCILCYSIFICLKETCCWCIRHFTEYDTPLLPSEDHNDNGDPEIDQLRNAMHGVFNSLLEEYATLQRGTEEQRRNALRNLQRRHPSKEYSDDHQLDIDVCAICTEEFKEGEKIRVLGCHHEYHVDCIDDCLVRVSRRDTCPLCNSEVNMANSLVDATESTRLLTSTFGLCSSSTSANSSETSEFTYGNRPHSTDESGDLLAAAEGSVNYVENESDDVQLI